jgi:hypothetical protein
MHRNFTKKLSSRSTRSSSMNFNIPSIKVCESATFYYSGIKNWNLAPKDNPQKLKIKLISSGVLTLITLH